MQLSFPIFIAVTVSVIFVLFIFLELFFSLVLSNLHPDSLLLSVESYEVAVSSDFSLLSSALLSHNGFQILSFLI